MRKVCFTCSKEFMGYRIKKHAKTFCSQKCYWQSLKGQPSKCKGSHQIAWNKGLKGVQVAWNKGVSYHSLEKHNLWKGDLVGYTALHQWVRKQLGKPVYCSNHKRHIAKRYVWANISGEYKRDITDWHSLCNSCNLTDGISVKSQFIKKSIRRVEVYA